MKSSAYVVLLCCCTVAVPALAADDPAPALDLGAEPLATPAVGNCTAPLEEVLFAATGGSSSLVTCTADCGPYTDVSCSTSGTCTAVDRNCPWQRGYVKCNGVYTFCPVCPCQEGAHRFTFTGNCCDCGVEERSHEQCIYGEWVFVDIVCRPNTGPCPFCP